VVDDVPTGLAATHISHAGVLSGDGARITWTLADLAVGASVELTFDVTISDLTKRPFVNVAGIATDSAGTYSTDSDLVVDEDSVPGDDPTSDADNTEIAQAGGTGDVGFDDEDIAVLDSPVTYDLAIDKRLLPDQRYKLGDPVRYEVTVTNQGNVPSGLYSFTDTIPPGMAFVAASHGGAAVGAIVTWADRPSLNPGESATVTVDAKLTDVNLASYRNWVEITDDSAEELSTETDPVVDVDSKPGNGEHGEDDDDAEAIPITEVLADNTVAPGPLPRTGGDPIRSLQLAALALVVGAALRRVSRGSRKGA
jgi:uncharacterized repeat protein (TIGR01451 family)